MNLPKVSVIIPNYNHAQFLAQRIESVLNQTYPNFEVIILDDNSSDESKKIIETYEDHVKVMAVIFNEKNSGNPFLQWQKGLTLAQGEWVWFAESDDYAEPQFLEILISSIPKEDKNVGLVYCDSKIVEGETVQEKTFADLKNDRFGISKWSECYVNEGKDEIENFLLPGGTVNNSSAVIFNKGKLLEVNPFDLNLRYIGDKYAFIKILTASKIVYVNKSLNYFRNPFNTKHADRLIYYFYEQFLVFDYVYKNIQISDYKTYYKGFYMNTNNSLVRDWSLQKLNIYKNLFKLNPYLFLKNILHNLLRPFKTNFN